MAPKQQKWFIRGRVLEEYDYVTKTATRLLTSVLMMSGATYYILHNANNTAHYIVGGVILIVGFLIYALSEHGKDLIAFQKKTHSGHQSLNVHLGIGWLSIVIIIVFLIISPKNNATLNIQMISDTATAIIIAESILIVLIVSILPKLKKYSLSLFNIFTVGLISSFLVLFSTIFNVWPSFVWVLLNLSLSLLFLLFGLFFYYYKKTMSQKK